MGISPENKLLSSCNSIKCDNFANEVGISPLKLLLESHSFLKAFMLSKKLGGMEPENWLPESCMDLMLRRRLIAGIGPEKELLTKLMVRSSRTLSKESTSIVPDNPMLSRRMPITLVLRHVIPVHEEASEEQGSDPGIHESRALFCVNDFLRLISDVESSIVEDATSHQHVNKTTIRRRLGTRKTADDDVDAILFTGDDDDE